jgi:hypothetical protein
VLAEQADEERPQEDPGAATRSTPFWNVVCGWDDMTMCVVHTARLVWGRCHHSATISAIAAAVATRRAWTARLLVRGVIIVLQGRVRTPVFSSRTVASPVPTLLGCSTGDAGGS